jgi:hypothetical protein
MGVQPKKPTSKSPAEWFTGDVWIDRIVEPDGHEHWHGASLGLDDATSGVIL